MNWLTFAQSQTPLKALCTDISTGDYKNMLNQNLVRISRLPVPVFLFNFEIGEHFKSNCFHVTLPILYPLLKMKFKGAQNGFYCYQLLNLNFKLLNFSL